MRSLSLFVLLLFAVVVLMPPPLSASSPTLMEELLGNGAPRRFKSCSARGTELYLTDERPAMEGLNLWALPRQVWGPFQDWTFDQINDREVAIKSNRGTFIGHRSADFAKQVGVADEEELLTPVKNADGSWSFKSRWNKWLSADHPVDPDRLLINFRSENKKCEHWWLEPYTPPETPPLMAELLMDGGRRKFQTFDGLYLTYHENRILRNELTVTPLAVGNEKQLWTIEQINEKEVAIRGSGRYVSHSNGDVGRPQSEANEWEMLTPVKNADGTWSFKSRWNKWLSGGGYREGDVHFMPENLKCERWTLKAW